MIILYSVLSFRVNKMTSKYTVFIRTKNSDWVLAQTLTSLYSQDLKFNVRVVDSGSTDKTIRILNDFNINPSIIKPSDYIPGKVINDAMETIESEIIIMLNSDSVLLNSDSLEKLVAPFNEDPNIIATVGRQIPRHDASPWVRRDYQHAFPEEGVLPEYIHLSFPLTAFRRSVWEKEKFYTESWGSEDSEWGKRLKDKKMGKIKYVPQALTMHSHNYNLKQLFNRKFIEGEADYFIYGSRPSFFNTLKKIFRRTASEVIYYLKNRIILSIPFIPIRNIVYGFGEYKGLLNAKKRDGKNDSKVVLKDYQ